MNTTQKGLLYGMAAYGSWGLFPLYWKLLAHLPAYEILFHRIVWAASFFLFLLFLRRGASAGAALWRNRRHLLLFALSGSLVAGNWFVYIHAVNTGQVLEASLGYFINPLMSIALGAFFLKERLTRVQALAVAFAGAGVAGLVVVAGHFPVIALFLATSFAFYALIRKRVACDPLIGAVLESAVVAIPVFAASTWVFSFRWSTESLALSDWLLLVLGGAITGYPLLLFAEAAKRLPLATLGFLQFFSPTLQFLLAVVVYKEPVSSGKLAGFLLIWMGLGLYTFDLLGSRRAWRSAELTRDT